VSVLINNTEELLHLVRKLGIKVTSVEELEHLLKSINASYNPEADRIRLVRRVALSVPIVACVFASIASCAIVSPPAHAHEAGIIGVIWGCTALICVAALVFSLVALALRRTRPTDKAAFLPKGVVPLDESSTGITDRLGAPGEAWQRG
jgi:hypothetical protein